MSKSYDITGKVKLIGQTQTFGSGFTKREIVLTVESGKYPQDISIGFIKENTQMLDGFVVGQEVTISFNIRGREYNGRYFNNLEGWKINAAAGAPPVSHGAEPDAEWEDDDDVLF